MNVTASDWLINLEQFPDDLQLRQQFDNWLSLSDENRRDWEETVETWRLLGMTVPAYPDLLAKLSDPSLGNGDKGQGVSSIHSGAGVSTLNAAANDNKRSWGRIAIASCAVLVLAFITNIFEGFTYIRADYSTGAGETRDITLSDGSIVTLAPESAIIVDMNHDQRAIELLSGTAYFNVQPDKSRPFKVQSRDVETTVLGTAFDIDVSSPKTQVAVSHGLVNVTKNTRKSFKLSRGDILTVDPTGQALRQKTDVANISAWRRGQLYAKNKLATEVISDLDRYFNGWFLIQSKKLENKKLTGLYNLSEPIEALSIIAETYKVKTYEIS
ncbi:FecR family protein, partial [Curvivirga aplysinae]|uniref:FecR family protein n=1 Tax=Curvivirga aplysinae TaxID=2529852 RepID=UPI001F206470